LARPRPLLASGAACAPRHALSVCLPDKFDAPHGEPPRHARLNAPAAQETGLLRGSLQVAFPQSLREHRVQPFRLAAAPQGAHNVVSGSADPGLASTVRLDHLFKPQGQRRVQLAVGPHG
jgi:hypothetical protein